MVAGAWCSTVRCVRLEPSLDQEAALQQEPNGTAPRSHRPRQAGPLAQLPGVGDGSRPGDEDGPGDGVGLGVGAASAPRGTRSVGLSCDMM